VSGRSREMRSLSVSFFFLRFRVSLGVVVVLVGGADGRRSGSEEWSVFCLLRDIFLLNMSKKKKKILWQNLKSEGKKNSTTCLAGTTGADEQIM